jgi:virginiamycin B lyase
MAAVLLWLAGASCSAETEPSASASTVASVTAAPPATSVPGTSRATASAEAEAPTFSVETFPVPAGSHPHDVAPAVDGGVWYTAQGSGRLGWLDPEGGEVREVALGSGSAPHGVIVGPDGAPWVTDSGLNAIVRVDPETQAVEVHRLPGSVPNANLNTAAFDADGVLWFTGQAGWYGRLDPAGGEIEVFAAPRGTGPYGITATPDGEIYYASLAGSYLGAVDRETGEVRVIEPPTAGAGVRRAWADSKGNIWISEWNAGQVARYDPATDTWQEWPLPGDDPHAYAVYVDETDAVWLSDFGADAILRFDPDTETFTSFPAESQPAAVRQLLGRPGEVWGAESAADRLVVVRRD